MTARFVSASVSAFLLLVGSAPAVDITGPGQSLAEGETGIVQVDITCGPGDSGLGLAHRSTLDLNGHVIDGCGIGGTGAPGQRQSIRIIGPGEVRNGGLSINTGTLNVSDVTITDAPGWGIYGANGHNGGPSTVRLTNVTVTGSGRVGVEGTKVKLRNATVNDSGANGPDHGIVGWASVDGNDVTVTGTNGIGIFSTDKITLRDALITDNTDIGILANLRIRLVRATVTGNGVDLLSQIRPRLTDTTCDSSANMQQVPWGVCSGD